MTKLDGRNAQQRQDVVADHAQIARRRKPGSLTATILRARSLYAREVLAELAWPGNSPNDIYRWAAGSEAYRTTEASMDPKWMAEFAKVMAFQDIRQNDRVLARRILSSLLDRGQITPDDTATAETLLQLHLLYRDRARAADILARFTFRNETLAAAMSDLSNPALNPGSNMDNWLTSFNKVVGQPGLTPYIVAHENDKLPLFDRIAAPARDSIQSRYRVTVIMSCFRPDRALLTAVASVLNQTWINLELIIVDDNSGSAYASLLDQVEASDDRIMMIRKTENGGTYTARNTALRVATGDFCTVVDSDDYVHPEFIERSIQPLLANPNLVATQSLGARLSPDLEFNRVGYTPIVKSAASLFFRRQPVTNRIGFFDASRKAADTEYARRLSLAFEGGLHEIKTPLALLRTGESLSASDFGKGWRHDSRHAYKSSYNRWHQDIRRNLAVPFLDPEDERTFPAPRRYGIVRKEREHDRIDVCIAGDWRKFGGPQASMIEEIEALTQHGFRVAVMHLEALRFMTPKDQDLCGPIVDLIYDGTVERIHLDDDVRVAAILIRYPPILQYPPHIGATIKTENVVIVANQSPSEPDGSDRRYVVDDVTRRTRELFNTDPWWAPQGPAVRKILQDEGTDVRLTSWDNHGLINPSEWRVRDPEPPSSKASAGKRIVIGRYSRDDHIKFPATFQDLVRAYGFDDRYCVRMMGAPNTVVRMLRDEGLGRDALPRNWDLIPHGRLDPRDFLRELDFFVYYDNPNAYEAFGRVLLEAAASGVLTIADPKHEQTFGDLFDYAAVDEVHDLVDYYIADPEAYLERVQRTLRAVESRYGHEAFVQRLVALCPTLHATGAQAQRIGANDDAISTFSHLTKR